MRIESFAAQKRRNPARDRSHHHRLFAPNHPLGSATLCLRLGKLPGVATDLPSSASASSHLQVLTPPHLYRHPAASVAQSHGYLTGPGGPEQDRCTTEYAECDFLFLSQFALFLSKFRAAFPRFPRFLRVLAPFGAQAGVPVPWGIGCCIRCSLR